MNWKATSLLVLLALPGVAASALLAVPLLVDRTALSVPLATLQVATAVQSAFLVVVAAVTGVLLAGKVGVSAPALFAVAEGRNVREAWRPQWMPGLVGGCIGAAVIVAFHVFAPDAIRAAQPDKPLPLAVRVLYGGITEEVLIRWGLMTATAWAGWKLFQRHSPQPTPAMMWSAIVVSALVFGVSHLPVLAQSLPALSGALVAYVTIGNALFGVVAGYLFWRYGLEAALAAHVLAHVFAFLLRG